MKKYLLAVVLFLPLVACRPGTDSPPAGENQTLPTPTSQAPPTETEGTQSFRLEPGRAGVVEINMTVTDLQAAVPASLLVEKQILQEGQEYTVYEIMNDSFSHETGLVAEPLCQPECRIFRIQVRDRKFQTEAGIGISSFYRDLRRAHPISRVQTETGEVVAVSESLGMSFILDPNTLPNIAAGPQLKPESIPDSALVARILIF